MKLIGWTMTEGRIPGEHQTRNPAVSDVVVALEAIHEDLCDPFVILLLPENAGVDPGFCQAYAGEDATYQCEIRIFSGSAGAFQQQRLLRVDELGRIGGVEPDRPDSIAGYDPDLATTTSVFMAFIKNSTEFPKIPGWQWIDITHQFDAVT